MLKKLGTILGINPGTRYIGLAVFQGPVLIDWSTKALKGGWSKEKQKKIKAIIIALIERYQPAVLVIKKLHPSRSSRHLNFVVKKIKEIAKIKRVKVKEYPLSALETFFSPEQKINKKEMAKILASQYPELFLDLQKEAHLKNSYYLRLFEAVGLGALGFSHFDKS